ncbi:kinase-like domain-containing protein [Rhizophagus clarus]|uniref:Kinase-like domain-containing protein n=1 Tax=Rhizophagus clarus TaxID=94130 RepID=A0A8H3M7B5_9GLOM|nr:kinase-like domain-containing protein [Rhizophagus clarus]
MQLNINNCEDIIFEWIPYSQFYSVKKIYKCESSKIYSAKWKNGPLSWYILNTKYVRYSNEKVVILKYLHTSPGNITNGFLSDIYKEDKHSPIYGISQNPDTEDYIMVLGIEYYCVGCEIGKCDFATIYSAEWKDGHLFWYKLNKEYTRNSYERVVLECLHTSHNNITNEFLNEIYEENKHSLRYGRLMYGISQNPNTKQYTLIFNEEYTFFDDNDKHLEYLKKFCLKCGKLYTNIQHKWCKSCRINDLEKNFANWTSGNENNIVVVNKSSFTIVYSAIWNDGPIYYNQDERTSLNKLVALISLNNSQNITDEFLNKFNSIKEEGKSSFATMYSAIWKDGPMFYNQNERKNLNKKVALMSLSNSQNIVDEFLKEDQNYLKEKCYINKSSNIIEMYGISQNSVTNDYVIVLDYIYFEYYYAKCNKIYTNTEYKWSIWKDGPICYNQNERKNLNKLVALKSLSNSHNISNEFLKEVQNYSREMRYTSKSSNILKIYGMSQNPNTKNYIMVLEYANGGNFDKYWIKKNYTTFNWDRRIISLYDIIKGLMEIHQKHTIHCDFHTGNILYDFLQRKVYISDMGLCREVNNTDKTKIYGVMPYVAPEILRGKSYTQAADIYSFGMIMYFMATGRQPFDNRAHDYDLALDMCKGIRPDINEPEAPEFYINLMKRCWDSNPDKRPNVVELEKEINSYTKYKIKSKFREAEEYRKANFSSFKDNLSATHSHAIYTSRLLNPFTKDLPKYDDDQELSSKITVYNKEDNEVDYNNTSESLENCKI